MTHTPPERKLDLLVYESSKPMESCFKLVLPSMTAIVSRRIKEATRQRRDIFLTGNLMGRGPSVTAVKKHLKAGLRVLTTTLAAKTTRDDPAQVTNLGVEIVAEAPNERLERRQQAPSLGQEW